MNFAAELPLKKDMPSYFEALSFMPHCDLKQTEKLLKN
jgi:hypothetical protein